MAILLSLSLSFALVTKASAQDSPFYQLCLAQGQTAFSEGYAKAKLGIPAEQVSKEMARFGTSIVTDSPELVATWNAAQALGMLGYSAGKNNANEEAEAKKQIERTCAPFGRLN